jgi:hypothetical protein
VPGERPAGRGRRRARPRADRRRRSADSGAVRDGARRADPPLAPRRAGAAEGLRPGLRGWRRRAGSGRGGARRALGSAAVAHDGPLRRVSARAPRSAPAHPTRTCRGRRPARRAPSEPRATKIERDGEPVAVLLHDPALRDAPQLLDAVCAAAYIALENARLHVELHARLDELKGSRARILEAAQDERRRLERNLHEAVVTANGLSVALDSLAARGPMRVRNDSAGLPRLPEPLEVAIYFFVAECLTNVAKYAQAREARVSVQLVDGQLVAEVADDGVGGADPRAGSGLLGLADRLERSVAACTSTAHPVAARAFAPSFRASCRPPTAADPSPIIPCRTRRGSSTTRTAGSAGSPPASPPTPPGARAR